jgi:kumamolisin
VPDVAINADPGNGYSTFIGGGPRVVGGTGAGAALWAGLIARINQALGHNIGYINPLLYAKFGPDGTLRNVVNGDDVRKNMAGSSWNAITGWGSPDGRKLLAALQNAPTSRADNPAR